MSKNDALGNGSNLAKFQSFIINVNNSAYFWTITAGHVLKPETPKRNRRNETTETTGTTEITGNTVKRSHTSSPGSFCCHNFKLSPLPGDKR